jgi:hypothetical protein
VNQKLEHKIREGELFVTSEFSRQAPYYRIYLGQLVVTPLFKKFPAVIGLRGLSP